MGLTVVIPTKNEEKDLPHTLESVKWADEILVIDTGSTDDTIKIAQKYGARVIEHQFINFTELRNFGDIKAKNDWVLSIDADVVVPQELVQEIKSVILNAPTAYKIGRINIIFGRPILHSDWGPKDDNHVRLYHRSLGKWQGEVHEIFSATNSRQLKHYLKHYNYNSVEEYVAKVNFYSDLEVERRRKHGEKFTYLKLLSEPLRDFGKRFVYKLGFLDGWHGLFLAYLQAIYYLTVQVKMYSEGK